MPQDKLKVVVHYAAAAKPFKDDDVDRSETVGHFKARVLEAFGLVDGATQDGKQVVYFLQHGDQRLEDMSQMLGAVAGDKHELQLNLVQQVTQG
jgi:hypothetical protein